MFGSGNSALDVYGTYLMGSDGVSIYFDCVEVEEVVRDAEITEFPVEVGANISDHYRVKVNEVHLEVFVSNEPIRPGPLERAGFYGAQILNTPEYPGGSTLAGVAKAVVNPVGTIASAIGGLLDSTTRPVTMHDVLQFPAPFNSLQSLLEKLDNWRSNATLADVVTAAQTYSGFALGKISTHRDKETGSGSKVAIELKRILTVSTQLVAAPVPIKPKDTPPIKKGPQQPTDPGQYQSLASKLLGAITGGP